MPFGMFAERTRLSAAWNSQTPELRGILLMLISTVAFSIMHASVRHVSASLPPFQIAFFRNLFGLLFLLPLLIGGGFAQMRTRRLSMHAFRGLINIGAMLMFFSALAITPLAKVTALSFTAPIFAAILSVVFLGERFRAYRWIAILMGFAGMLIILRPGFAVIETGAVLAAAAALLWAVAMILIKSLSRTESSVAIVAWMGMFLGLFSLGPALWVWQHPTWSDIGWVVFIGLTGSIAQVCLSQSFKETDPTAVLPLDFLKLIWTALLGAWFFAETPDVYTWVGASVIFSSGLYIANRERRARKAAGQDSPKGSETPGR